jgi:hypothetical protein
VTTYPEKFYGWHRRAGDHAEKRRLLTRGALFLLALVLL